MCAFCQVIERDREVVYRNDLAVGFPDAFPSSPGHHLIVPRRHESDFFALSAEEQTAIWDLAREAKKDIFWKRTPDAMNVGINVGKDAGQTIDHAHLHLIPRYRGDVDDPRGGVRWVLRRTAPYWATKGDT